MQAMMNGSDSTTHYVGHLSTLGVENAYGDADYWLVDDDYGDTTHKICVHSKSILKPALITAIQRALKRFHDGE